MKKELASFGMTKKVKNLHIFMRLNVQIRSVPYRHALACFEYLIYLYSHNRKDSITKQTKKDKKKMIFILLINLIKIEI